MLLFHSLINKSFKILKHFHLKSTLTLCHLCLAFFFYRITDFFYSWFTQKEMDALCTIRYFWRHEQISASPVYPKPLFAYPPHYILYISPLSEWEPGFWFLHLLRQFGFGSANRNAPFLALFPLQAAWLLKAVTCIDLTTLSGDDTPSNVQRLCFKAKHPIREDLLKALDMHDKGMVAFGVFCRGNVCISSLFSHFSEGTLVCWLKSSTDWNRIHKISKISLFLNLDLWTLQMTEV